MTKSLLLRRSGIIAILLILITALVFRKISTKDVKSNENIGFRTVNVQTAVAQNMDKKLIVDLSGKLIAKNRIDIYSEVNGILQTTNFREGQRFSKGQVLVSIDDSELRSNIKSQKSSLLNSISSILPDLSIDYPNDVETWKQFHSSIDFDKSLPELPALKSDKLRIFLSSKNVFTSYFAIKSLEQRLAKHQIIAPFSGVLSTADIHPGTLVRGGQRIGTFIQPNNFELEASLSLDDLRFIKVGNTVELFSKELDKKWNGTVLRINEQLDAATQSVRVYIGVSDSELKEGQYLNAEIQGNTLTSVVQVPRKLLLDKEYYYFVVNDTILTKQKVDVAYKGTDWVYLKGIKDGEVILNQPISSAYDGMIVKQIESNK